MGGGKVKFNTCKKVKGGGGGGGSFNHTEAVRF